MITTILALAVSLQSASEVGTAVKNEAPQTWTVEYPRAISPYVAKYYDCLKSREVVMHGATDFETQHRLAVPKCATVRAVAAKDANALLARRAKPDEDGSYEVAVTLNTIEMIHIARGKDLDKQMALMAQGRPYERKVEEVPVSVEPATSDNEAATQ